MTRALLLALLLLPTLPVLASAAPSLRLRDAGRARLLISDGERFLITSRTRDPGRAEPGQLTVRDLRRGTLRTIEGLPGCRPVSARVGKLVWDCPVGGPLPGTVRGVLEDLRTGERESLPTFLAFADADGANYVGVGRRWLLVAIQSATYNYAGEALFDRATGQPQPLSPDPQGRDEVIDLDAESGRRTLCDGLRAPLVPTDSGPVGDEVGPGSLDIEGRRASTRTLTSEDPAGGSEMVYQRCGRPERVLERCRKRTPCGDPQLRGRWIAWTREAPGRKPYLSEAVLYDTRSRRRRYIPRAEGVSLLAGRIAVLRHGRILLGRLPLDDHPRAVDPV